MLLKRERPKTDEFAIKKYLVVKEICCKFWYLVVNALHKLATQNINI